MSEENSSRPQLPALLPAVASSPVMAKSLTEGPAMPGGAGSPFGIKLMLSGTGIIVALLGMAMAWSLLAPLESAVVAPGLVTVDSNVKTIQHLEGGIVEAILVREGDQVKAGDVLIKLQNTLPESTLNEVRAQYYEALATQARLVAERDGQAALALPEELRENLADPAAREAFTGQQVIFESRLKLFDQSLTIFEGGVEGLKIEIGGLEGQIQASETRLNLVDEELSAVLALLRQGFADKPRALALQRQKAEIKGAISSFRASIGVARQRIIETVLKMAELKSARISEVVQNLDEVRTRAYELSQKLAAAQDVFSRTEIRAPIDGVVVGVQVHTLGGVIAAGQPLMDIVPSNDKLVIHASIDPLDIDQVKVGLPATAQLWALNRRDQTTIEGRLETVSADRLVDPNTGSAYYLARVVLSTESPELKSVTLQPGMSADVMIRTGARTPWQYISAPISRTLSRSFREQ